ncbi:MAG: acyl-CoA thioesterase [Bdellovibrionales bacterium]
MNTVFEYPLIIRESHLDTFGHVNNAVYLTLFEEARWEFVTARGYGLDKIRETNQGPVILAINLAFKHEVRLRDQIVIRTQLDSYNGKIGIVKQWMNNQNGELCCEAVFTMGFFDLKTRKLILPTPEWMYAVGEDKSSTKV